MSKYENMKLVSSWHKAMRMPCEKVEDIDEDVREFIPYLIRTMRREDGIGITANQVGISKAVFLTNVPGDHIRIFINPVLVGTGGKDVATKEGCLSFAGKQISRQRKRHAVIRAFNLKGEQFILDTRSRLYKPKTSVLMSVCLQHEMDHINGVDLRKD